MTITEYLSNLNRLYITGNAREHSYRGDLQTLISTFLPDVLVTNEPARVSCGAPDYMLSRKDIPVGYIEAKDINVDLGHKSLKEQFDRYKAGLSNLIITDYLKFQFYKDGDFVTEIAVAKLENNQIVPLPGNFAQFGNLVENFVLTVSQSIKSPTRLAKMMAGKAKLMADVIEKSLNSDDEDNRRSNLKSQMISFKQMLIHDITNKSFADIYSQTIAYGMFAARYHDPTLDSFSRTEAAQLIPKSNPFLRKLFQDIAGFDLDDRLVWIVDELVNIFLASDVSKIMTNFGKATKQEDPVVHFYETFLGEYNPALRKARGVWYTPQPVVNFIVRAVDDILKTEFNLPQGLADTSKTKIKVKVPTHDKRYAGGMRDYEQEVHKVQILDPATGTGTFLAEVVRHIHKKFEGQQGIWSRYVTNDLIPRLNGFELLMASYAMAHLKLDMLLTETGYKPTDEQRLRIFLTNSLEEAHPNTGTLFSSWLSDEADQANAIKRDAPVMCVIGNPPYSVSSANKGEWIESLTADYKKNLNERNIQPLSDDYIKFIRYGQHFIDKNGEGILAYISNNSFLDGVIHRQMRKNILESFDKAYILNLHGNSSRKETTPDGSPDENVFDIKQGVSINIFVKTGKKKKEDLGQVFYSDLFGKREEKYEFLNKNSISEVNWNSLNYNSDYYFFVYKDFSDKVSYEKGFSTNELFPLGASGIKTERDGLVLQFTPTSLSEIVNDLKLSNIEEFRSRHRLTKDGRDWKLKWAKEDIVQNPSELIKVHYRPFDYRYTFYTGNSKGFQAYPRKEITSHFINKNNFGLIHLRQNNIDEEFVSLITNVMTEKGSLVCGNYFISPLYLYPEKEERQEVFIDGRERTPNLKEEIVFEIAQKLGLEYTFEKEDLPGTFAPIDLLDYIYAVLHSPSYRKKYKEFLKIDFPRIPYPQDAENFWELVKLGCELRQLHLLESPLLEQRITGYPEDGDNIITRKISKNSPGYEAISETEGKVWINDQQYFENVPLVAWEFYIGGYQPAQKWLKDRKGRELSYEDISHYQKIIVALTETERLMKAIDKVGVVREKQETMSNE